MSDNRSIYPLMVLVAFIWGGTFNAAGFALTGFHPLAVSWLRFALATAVLLMIGGREILSTPVRRSDWPGFFLLGLTGIFAYNIFFMYAMQLTSAVNGSLITAANPIVTAVLAALVLREKFTARLAGGALLSFVGVVLVISGGSWQAIRALQFNFGDILAILSVLSWSLYALVIKSTSRRFSPMITTFYGFLTGTLLLSPCGLLARPGPAALAGAGWPALTAVLYLALIGSVLAFFWWNRGVSILGAGRSSVFLNLIPVGTILISVFFREPVTLIQGAGCLLIAGAVTLAADRRPHDRPRTPAEGTGRGGAHCAPPPAPQTHPHRGAN